MRHHIRDYENAYAVEGHHEAIVDRELFDKAQELLARNKQANPRKLPREANYFSGLLTCGSCGWKMVTHNIYRTLKDGTKAVTGSYRCQNKTYGVCKTSSISHNKFEHAFEEYISKIPDLDVTDDVKIEEQRKRENTAQIKAYNERLRLLEVKERESLNFYVDNEMDFESYREIKKKIGKEKAIVSAELEKLENADHGGRIVKADIINNIRENWGLLNASERRQFLLENIEKITLVVEKTKGQHYSAPKIMNIDYQPSYENKRSTREILRNR